MGVGDAEKMFEIMIEISRTSLKALGSEIFNQITKQKVNNLTKDKRFIKLR